MELESRKRQHSAPAIQRVGHLLPQSFDWRESTAWLERNDTRWAQPVRWVTDGRGGLESVPTVLDHDPVQADLVRSLLLKKPFSHGEQYLKFSQCAWASELRTAPRSSYENDSAWVKQLASTVPAEEFGPFCEAIKTWQTWAAGPRRAAIELLAGAKPDYWTEPLTRETQSLLSVLAAMPPAAPKLYRGVALHRHSTAEQGLFSVGDTLHLTPQSFSEDRHHAELFGRWLCNLPGPSLSILMRCAPGSRSLCIAPFSKDKPGWNEAEWIVAGTFQITGTEQVDPNRLVVSLEPVAGVEALACGPEEGPS